MKPVILKSIAKPHAKDAIFLTDAAGLAALADYAKNSQNAKMTKDRPNAWCGGRYTYAQTIDAIKSGDMATVAEADDMLARLENKIPNAYSRSFETVNDVVGAVPDIGAFVSGSPMSMRRRNRTVSDMAPLTVFADGTLSAGISAADMRKRGVALLALVRLLAQRRPVDLYFAVGAGNSKNGVYVLCRIETAPLDIARAAVLLTAGEITRSVCYGITQQVLTDGTMSVDGWGGGWAYSDANLYRQNFTKTVSQVVSPGSECVYLAAAHLNDPAVTNPEQWILDALAKYGGEAFQTKAA